MHSIRVRLFAYLFILFIISFTILFGSISYLITREYSSFEKSQSMASAKQLQKGYQNITESLASRAYDWSRWDDAYGFMKTRDKKFIESNLSTAIVCGMHLNYILFVDEYGQIVTEYGCNLQTKKELALPSNFSYHLSPERQILKSIRQMRVVTGLVSTSQGALLLTAQPVLSSTGTGPARGTLIFAYLFTPDYLTVYTDSSSRLTFTDIVESKYTSIQIETPDDRTIVTSFDLSDITDKPVTRIVSTSPRIVYGKRIIGFQYLFVGLSSVGFLLLLSQYIIVEAIVTRKIMALIKAAASISHNQKEKIIDIPEISHDDDEFLTLQNSLNGMVASLISLSKNLTSEQRKAQQYLDLMNTVIRVLDKNHTILLINKKGCEVLGYAREELIGKNWIEMVLPSSQREYASQIQAALFVNGATDPHLFKNESEVVLKSGEKHLIQWSNAVVTDIDGSISSILSSGFDISEEKNTQRQLEIHATETEKLNSLMINRELEMIELKKKIKKYEE